MTRALTMLNESGGGDLIMTAQLAAKASGQKTFTVKTPCVNGHAAPRMTSTGRCSVCRDQDNKRNYRIKCEAIKQHERDKRERKRNLQHDAHVKVIVEFLRHTSRFTTLSRGDAKRTGKKRFFTGRPCRNGHTAERITSTGKCLVCHRNRCTRQYRANPDRARAKKRAYDEANRQLISERARARWHANPELSRQYHREWRKKDPERSRKTLREWYKRNAETEMVRSATKRARRLMAEGVCTVSDKRRILVAQKYKCAMPTCRANLKKTKKHMDHIIPLARGVTNWPRNCQFLCWLCNQEKHAKDPIDFAREKGLLL